MTKSHWGLLGLGSRSTLYYLEQLNLAYQHHKGGDSTCPITLLNSDFNAFNPYLPDQFSHLEPSLKKYLHICCDLGIKQLIIPNITLHECYDRIIQTENIPLNIIHPVLNTVTKLQCDNIKKVIIIGSKYSMQSARLKQAFTQAGIETTVPNEEDCLLIDNIRQLVYSGKESQEDLSLFKQAIEKYKAQAPLIIACTELSIALLLIEKLSIEQYKPEDQTQIYDMSRIQMADAVSGMINEDS